MAADEEIAVVTAVSGYDGLNAAFRLRAEQLNITRDDVDLLGGLTGGHAGKLLSAYPRRAIGRTTLGPILHALKLKLLVVTDESVVWKEQPAGRKLRNRGAMLHTGEHGPGNMPESRALTAQVLRQHLQKHARKALKLARRARMEKTTAKQRRRIAKTAARARWNKPKLTELKGAAAAQAREQAELQLRKPAPHKDNRSGELTSAQRMAPSRARSKRPQKPST